MQSLKKGILVEIISIIWMLIEAGVAIASGVIAHSLALVVFGVDSVIELVAGVVLLWRLLTEAQGASIRKVERAEKISSWVVGIALLLLAVYIVGAAIYDLWSRQSSESSPLGIALAVAAGIIMPYLSFAKRKIGTQIGSRALRADGACSIVCAYMAWTLIAGLLLHALFGWWWVDSVAALALVYFVVKEGLEAIEEARGGDSCDCGCH